TGQTGDALLAQLHDVTDILLDVPIGRVQGCELGWRIIGFEITKQVIAGHKVVRVWQTGALRFARANMTLGADRRDDASRVLSLLGQKHQGRIFGVLQIDIAMTDVTIESDSGKR